MLDNALISLIISTILAGESAAGIAGTPIKQAFQPTLQGVNTEPTAYLYKLSDKSIGWPYVNNTWDTVNNVMTHTETQQYETMFQISVLATQNPATPQAYTASDILKLIKSILQSSNAIATFEAQGVGILRISDIRNPYFFDDREQNEANPSIDFTITNKQTIITTMPIISETDYQIYIV